MAPRRSHTGASDVPKAGTAISMPKLDRAEKNGFLRGVLLICLFVFV